MNILFIHQNFPAQYKFLAPALAARGHKVVTLTMNRKLSGQWKGVTVLQYGVERGNGANVHPWLSDTETKIIRGEACYRAALKLKAAGFAPDVIVAHPGWGESLFLKDVWPQAKLGLSCEFYYHASGADVGFDPEFPNDSAEAGPRMLVKNTNMLLHMEVADAGISPTLWQASTFPERFRSRITVVHEGIDTEAAAPAPNVALQVAGIRLTRQDEVVTFVNRNLEPYRGYHVFMRALPELLRNRPQARVLIVGGDDVSYGSRPPDGRSWKDIFATEVQGQLTPEQRERVHFLGKIPYDLFIPLLQLSMVHVYLTYPFVLSWSMLEAMSIGCTIVASDTAPVREAIRDGDTGRLVDFFDAAALASTVSELLGDPAQRARLGARARAFAQETYDLNTVCLPGQVAWVEGLAAL